MYWQPHQASKLANGKTAATHNSRVTTLNTLKGRRPYSNCKELLPPALAQPFQVIPLPSISFDPGNPVLPYISSSLWPARVELVVLHPCHKRKICSEWNWTTIMIHSRRFSSQILPSSFVITGSLQRVNWTPLRAVALFMDQRLMITWPGKSQWTSRCDMCPKKRSV